MCYSKSVRRTVFDIFDFKNVVTLKTGLGVRHGLFYGTAADTQRAAFGDT